MQNMPIGIFRGDDTDAFGHQTIVGTIKTDLDLTGCKAVFRYLGFSMEFDPIPEDKKLTIVIPADETKKFPPGLGYASLRVYDSEGKLKTFSNRIMVFVATKTPMFGSDEFEVDFNVRASLEPLKFFVGPNPDDFDEYRGYVEKVIDRASAAKYGLTILLDAIDSDLGAEDGVAATPVAVKAAYAAIIEKLTNDYYTAEQTDEAIDRVAAYYITRNAAGDAFETKAQLNSATVFYSGGKVRVPTRNDYCVVLADESQGGAEYRYIYAVAEGQTTGGWQAQFPVEGVMTVDKTVTKNSTNPVSGGGVWSAIWGALAALPAGFTSLYDWCVAQLSGKASKADAMLTPIYSDTPTFSEWTFTFDPNTFPAGAGVAVVFEPGVDGVPSRWELQVDGGLTGVLSGAEDETELIFTDIREGDFDGTVTATRTRTDIIGYQLGSQDDKPLASEAEAEALRTGKQSALSTQQLANIAAVSDALAFDATHSYSAGDPVVYNGTLYTFTATHTGAWTGSDVSAVDIIAMLAGKLDKSGDMMSGDLIFDNGVGDSQIIIKDADGYPLRIDAQGIIVGKWNDNENRYDYYRIYWPDATDYGILALKSAIPYTLGTPIVIDTASSETVEGETVYYGVATLSDRTANIVQVTAATPLDELRITFPAATSGKVRDFGLRVEIGTGSAALAAPALVPIAPSGETIKIENADGTIPELADGTATAKGVTLLYFSETSPGVFVVKGEQVEEVA